MRGCIVKAVVVAMDAYWLDTFAPDALKLALAYALAFPIGWDREREERTAGVRTFPIVGWAR